MKSFCVSTALILAMCVCASGMATAAPQAEAQPVSAPTLIRLDGRVTAPTGEARPGQVALVISLYAQKDDPTPLWVENQTVTADDAGRYAVVAGATLEDGVPKEHFLSGEARWLGVAVLGEAETQPRIMFISVPYALKAREAETLTGKSASDFVLADDLKAKVKSAMKAEDAGGNEGDPRTLGTQNFIAKFDASGAAANIINSTIIDDGTNVGIGTPTPLSLLHFSNAANPAFRMTKTNAPAQSWFFEVATSGKFNISDVTAAKDRFTIDVAGNVGIGTTGPLSPLHISNPTSASLRMTRTNAPARTWFFEVATNGKFNISDVTAGADRFMIDTGGNVGIGTASPTERLEVGGSVKVTGGGNGVVFPDTRKQTVALFTDATNTAAGVTALDSNSSGVRNTAVGLNALTANTTGVNNTAVGASTLQVNTTGSSNVAIGSFALAFNTSGQQNTAIGDGAMNLNATGNFNTAVGKSALSLSTGSSNTAVGSGALDTTTASENTAVGRNALGSDTTGTLNAAVGYNSLIANTTGGANTAVGHTALATNTQGSNNTAVGKSALFSTTTGIANTAVGNNVLFSNTIGGSNVAVGDTALVSLVSGGGNIAIGTSAGSALATGSNNLYIDNGGGSSTESDTMRLGTNETRAFIAGIRGRITGVQNAVAVLIDSNGQLGTISSSQRYKEDIRDMAEASQGLVQLRPVTYRYKQAYADGSKPLDYGLIAEEVATVYPDLVVYDGEGRAETVQYQKLTPMLLNEAQKQHRRIAALEAEVTTLLNRLAALENAQRSAAK